MMTISTRVVPSHKLQMLLRQENFLQKSFKRKQNLRISIGQNVCFRFLDTAVFREKLEIHFAVISTMQKGHFCQEETSCNASGPSFKQSSTTMIAQIFMSAESGYLFHEVKKKHASRQNHHTSINLYLILMRFEHSCTRSSSGYPCLTESQLPDCLYVFYHQH